MVRQASELLRKIDALAPSDQELLAKFLSEHFDEVLSDARWQRLFDSSPETLDRLEAEVDEAIAKGEFSEFDPDEL
jgi:hypothetical protein